MWSLKNNDVSITNIKEIKNGFILNGYVNVGVYPRKINKNGKSKKKIMKFTTKVIGSKRKPKKKNKYVLFKY